MPKLNIGNSDFKKIRINGDYLIDKSLLIKDVLDGSDVTLIPRPRRFGKTLNMTMLHYFFEKTEESNAGLFDGLLIADDAEAMRHQGEYPVIFMSLKDIKGDNWDNAYAHIKEKIAAQYKKHLYIMDKLQSDDAEKFKEIAFRKANHASYESSLNLLISYLYAYHKKPVVILIDEYDSPVIESYQNGYYDKMILFMRAWLGGGLKHEDGMATFRAIITGILRITRESIFSDLNNLKVCTILTSGSFADKFGFTENEVEKLLNNFDLSGQLPDVQDWYNGYKFGSDVTIYNPWSVVNFVDNAPTPIGPQWLNTSSNALVYEELANGGLELKRDLEKLLAGKELRYPITENTVFDDIGKNPENIWSFLCLSGYLNATDPERDAFDELTYSLSIPNKEVSIVYQNFIKRWQNELKFTATKDLIMALLNENYAEFQLLLTDLIRNLVSYYDVGKYPEAAFHCFVLGLLASLRTVYDISSNAESGYGRADIIMRSKSPHCPLSFVIEFKVIGKDEDAEQTAEAALRQIEEKSYASRLTEVGIETATIRKLAIVIQQQLVIVKSA